MLPQHRPGIFHRTSKFESWYKDLDQLIQGSVDAALRAMAVNYADPWLDCTKMKGYTDKWRWAVTGQYRIVAVKRHKLEEFDLEFVGTKNQFKKQY